jgi:uncharacterized protein YraI
MKPTLPFIAGAIALMASFGAQAAEGFVTRNIDLMAGPGDYPTVTSVPGTAPVQIYGCVDNYRWCDVMWKDQRGWAPGDALQYQHEGRRVRLYDGSGTPTAIVEVPLTKFEFDTYWDNYYRERPFYRDRERYHRR